MGWLGVFLALLLPTLAGALWLRRFWSAQESGAWSLTIGYGYFVGMLGATLLLRLASSLGLEAAFWLVIAILAPFAWLGLRDCRRKALLPPVWRPAVGRPMAAWERVAVALLLGWMALRVGNLAVEAWLQPLFPWDAWTTWIARARVWSGLGQLVPFVPPAEWLQEPSGQAYTIAAWNYPETISLIALWPTLAYGAWSETAANLPWVGCMLALGLAFYGQARVWGASALTALVFVWLLLSLPLLDTHIALAGYADVWLASVFGLSAIALFQWSRAGDVRQGLLALGLALCSPLIKLEGAVWAALLVPALLAATVRIRWLILLTMVLLLVGLVVLALGGFETTIPGMGPLVLSWGKMQIPLLGQFELGFHDSWMATANSLFLYGNWHLLGYMLFPAIVFGVLKAKKHPEARWLWVQLTLVTESLLALFVLFFLTDAYRWAEQATSTGRLLLHFMPVYVFYLLTLWEAERSSEGQRSNALGAERAG